MAVRNLKKFLLIILCGLFIFISSTPAISFMQKTQPKEPPRAMWVWDSKIFQDIEASQRLFNFCKERDINLLFYTAYKVTGGVAVDYRRFNKTAHENGILVHALAGDPRWALDRYHQRFLDWAADILEFNKAASLPERFDGIHSDVEPYLLGKLWEQDNKAVLIQYLEANKKLKDLIDASGHKILLAVDVPFWYDDDVNMWVVWHKKLSPANYHILDIVDQIAIMDYRNFAEGENGSIVLAGNEISYADMIGKKVYIGQETQKDASPEYVTFGGGNVDYMEKEIKKLVKAYITHPSFAGIAIHHYISYKKLLKESGKIAQ